MNPMQHAQRKRRLASSALACALCLAGSTPLRASQRGPIVSHPSQLNTPPLRPFVPPAPLRLTLESGAQLLVIANNELPLVDGTLIFRAGGTDVADEHAGISALMADVLREGGSERTTGSKLDDWLDSHAASITVESTPDAFRVHFSCVKADLGSVLIFIGELLMIPAYPAEQVEKSRARALTQLARENEDAATLADRLLDRLTLGERSPLTRHATADSVGSITRRDLLAHHKHVIGVDRLLVGATGAIHPNAFAARLDSLLKKLPRVGDLPKPPAGIFRLPGRTTIYLQDRPNATHSEVRIAGPGIRRLDEDYVPLYLWSYAIGYGGSSNRMMLKLRTELGLIYDGSLFFRPDWNRNGRLLASCSTRNDAVGEVITALYELLHNAKQPLDKAELDAVRRRVLNAEVFQIDSPEEVLQRSLELELHDYPADFWTRRDERLRSLSVDDVAAAIGRHLKEDRLTILVVGPAAELAEPLASFGTLIRLENE